jgi:hypothetical protein
LIAFKVTLAAMTLQLCRVPLTVFDTKVVLGHRRERIETAVVSERAGDAGKADDRALVP